jgi:hypothetical protein
VPGATEEEEDEEKERVGMDRRRRAGELACCSFRVLSDPPTPLEKAFALKLDRDRERRAATDDLSIITKKLVCCLGLSNI